MATRLKRTSAATSYSLIRGWNAGVFPRAAIVAVPCSVLTMVIKTCDSYLLRDNAMYKYVAEGMPIDSSAYGTFTSMLGFLVIFRTSLAYNRYWEGSTHLHRLFSDWFDATATFFACAGSLESDEAALASFQHTLVRLMSLMHGTALVYLLKDSEAENTAVDVIGANGLDRQSLATLSSGHYDKVELLFYWVSKLCAEAVRSQVIDLPPPISTRAFQELASGMVAYHEALKIVETPFPFSYSQASLMLLIMHFMLTPLVIPTWTTSIFMSGMFSFTQVGILWALWYISTDLEEPFAKEMNESCGLHICDAQEKMNKSLLLLIDPAANRVPHTLMGTTGNEAKVQKLRFGKRVSRRGSVLSFETRLDPEARLDEKLFDSVKSDEPLEPWVASPTSSDMHKRESRWSDSTTWTADSDVEGVVVTAHV